LPDKEKVVGKQLRSLTGITRLVTWVCGIGALVIVIANVAALGWLPGTAPNPTCVPTGDHAGPLVNGAERTVSGANVCVDDPSFAQRLADIGDQVPQALFALGALYLFLRFLRITADGPSEPGRLSALGWFVLLGGAVSVLLFAVSQHFLRSSMMAGVPASDWLTQWQAFPWWSIAIGLAALIVAQFVRTRASRDHERSR
jgi:hypothetical protein